MNQKIIEAVSRAVKALQNRWHPSNIQCEAMAQAAINALWTDFDAGDENTWPVSRLTPSGDCWCCLYEYYGDRAWDFALFENGAFTANQGAFKSDVKFIAYTDPADLGPKK